MKVTIIQSAEAFNHLKNDWNDLLQKSRCNNIFLTWEWLYHWWAVYGDGLNELCIIAIRENGALIGIAPLYKKRYLFDFSQLNFLGSNIVCSDYLDFILLKGREKEILSSIFNLFLTNSIPWDTLSFTDIPLDSVTVSFIQLLPISYPVDLNMQYTICPYIDLSLPIDKIIDSYASELKNIIKRKLKTIENRFNARFEVIQAYSDLEGYFSQFLYLNKLSLGLKNIQSPFLDNNFLKFHKNILKELYPKGIARICILKAMGSVIASIYLLIYNDKVYYYQSGFDPAWSKLSPGTLLFHYCITEAYKNGAKEFDFLRGNEAYKNSWTRDKRFNVKMVIYNGTAKGRFLRFLHFGKNRLFSLLKRL